MDKTKIRVKKGLVFLAVLWLLPTAGRAATITVDCLSASLQAGIDKAKPGDILLVSGTCKENLLISEEVIRVTLDGQGKATISSPDEGKPTIQVTGRGITIKGFTVSGGLQGIAVGRGGQTVIDGNTVQGAARAGILVGANSFAEIVNNRVQNNSAIGIDISAGSSAFVGLSTFFDKSASPNVIQNNGQAGIAVTRGSFARIVGNTIRNNKTAGVAVVRAYADISSNTIEGNGGAGIRIENSAVSLGTERGSEIFQLPNSTTSNNSFAVRCIGNSSVDGRLGSLGGSKGVKDIDPNCVDGLKP